jgi:uncharacterized protein YlzI (FlbEa/FlbD family)
MGKTFLRLTNEHGKRVLLAFSTISSIEESEGGCVVWSNGKQYTATENFHELYNLLRPKTLFLLDAKG